MVADLLCCLIDAGLEESDYEENENNVYVEEEMNGDAAQSNGAGGYEHDELEENGEEETEEDDEEADEASTLKCGQLTASFRLLLRAFFSQLWRSFQTKIAWQ